MLLLEMSVQSHLGHLSITQPAPDFLGIFRQCIAFNIETVDLVQMVLQQSALFIKFPADVAFDFRIIGVNVPDVTLEFLDGDIAIGALLSDVGMNILVMC